MVGSKILDSNWDTGENKLIEMEAIQKYLSQIRIPNKSQSIFKDECVYSFDNPETSTGIYISLTTFLAFGDQYVHRYAEKSGNMVFLHTIRHKFLKNKENITEEESGPESKITRLGIGIEGGYNDANANKYEYKDTYSIVVMPNKDQKIPYPNPDLPVIVTESVQAIISSEGYKLEKLSFTVTWDGELRQISKCSEGLVQLNNGKKIAPSGWKCEKCDLTNNLWLNLTDGSILCGRKFFDGSGGNDHAVQHYKETGYPLAVKLGTITADGKSDVFSYVEDEMVTDSKLEEHLGHFGINMAAMKKSEKSMIELELEINQRIGEWSLLTESDSELKPIAGPGYTGMRNLGNSCYINSVMQVLFSIPDFIKCFVGEGAEKYFNTFPSDPVNDFNIQMSKLGNGLWSGKYSGISENSIESDLVGVSPLMFKNVVGKNHPDFSTKQQQDAYDFYLHLISLLEKNSSKDCNPIEALKFRLEDRVECMSSKKVKYTQRDEYCLAIDIPLEKATNLSEVNNYLQRKIDTKTNEASDADIIRHKVPLKECLENFTATEVIDQFYSSAINSITTAKKSTRFATMPDFLMVHLLKFRLGEDWVPKKLDVSIDMPDELDITKLRSAGLQPGEEPMPDSVKFVFDELILNELIQMGFPRESCKRALYSTKNSGLEAASIWIMEHIDDPNISEPFEIPNETVTKSAPYTANPESLTMLMSMGFNECQATKALKAAHGDVERATEWIFSNMDDTDSEVPIEKEPTTKKYRDGVGKYKLVAFISHMGTSAQVGHYVCHILKEGKWVIFNDNKVALSQNPPKDLGYLYLYQRHN